jgi:hypothetical protein
MCYPSSFSVKEREETHLLLESHFFTQNKILVTFSYVLNSIFFATYLVVDYRHIRLADKDGAVVLNKMGIPVHQEEQQCSK